MNCCKFNDFVKETRKPPASISHEFHSFKCFKAETVVSSDFKTIYVLFSLLKNFKKSFEYFRKFLQFTFKYGDLILALVKFVKMSEAEFADQYLCGDMERSALCSALILELHLEGKRCLK